MSKAELKIKIDGLSAKEAFAYFLKHEIFRHYRDIDNAEKDLQKLIDSGVKVPDIPPELWIEVK